MEKFDYRGGCTTGHFMSALWLEFGFVTSRRV